MGRPTARGRDNERRSVVPGDNGFVSRKLRSVRRRLIVWLVDLARTAVQPEVDPFALSPEKLTVGRGTYGRPKVRSYEGDDAAVQIGAFCSLADDIIVTRGGNHPLRWPTLYPFRARRGLPGAFEDGHPLPQADVRIGNDVWIGRGARILAGVQIGDGAVVGAYAVVATAVRPYAVVVGNPARELRRRFTDAQIDALLQISWWHWPDEKIDAHIHLLNQPDVDAFIEHCRGRGSAGNEFGER